MTEGPGAGGGAIEDILFLRCSSDSRGAEGYYSFHLDHSPTSSLQPPTRVRLVDCAGDRGVGVDQAIRENGYEAIGWRAL